MLIPNKLPNYRSYLLRFWQEQDQKLEYTWRFSLEAPHSGERLGFGSCEALMAFLEGELGSATSAREQERET